MSEIEIIDGIEVDWSKFKSNASDRTITRSKRGYVDFIKMLHDVGGTLISDYVSATDKLTISISGINITTTQYEFKRVRYKSILKFLSDIEGSKDKFIKFIGISDKNILIALIELELGEYVEISISQYKEFTKARDKIKNLLRDINGKFITDYVGYKKSVKVKIDDVITSIYPDSFARIGYKRILKFKDKLKHNGDTFIKFNGLSNNKDILIANIDTFDGVNINIDMASYDKFVNARNKLYEIAKNRNNKILSGYTGDEGIITVKFDCNHTEHTLSANAYKQGSGCPLCRNKGETSLYNLLIDIFGEVEHQKKYDDLKDKINLRYDFYIPKYNLLVEIDGDHHRMEVPYKTRNMNDFERSMAEVDAAIRLDDRKHKDKLKDEYAAKNNIPLLRIEYNNGKIELDRWKQLILDKIEIIEIERELIVV
jgi:very-short-patch-repair endonuclease